MLAPWKKSYEKPRKLAKKQRYHFANKGLYSPSYGFFPLDMYRCESWPIKKAETEELILSNCGAGEDSWESLEQQGDQTIQS